MEGPADPAVVRRRLLCRDVRGRAGGEGAGVEGAVRGLALLLLLSTAALAHGPGTDWIWSNPETQWCCSVRHGDCRAAFDGEAVEQPDGSWSVGKMGEERREFREGDRGFYYSRELVPWLCQFPQQNVRCFFAPPKGF